MTRAAEAGQGDFRRAGENCSPRVGHRATWNRQQGVGLELTFEGQRGQEGCRMGERLRNAEKSWPGLCPAQSHTGRSWRQEPHVES